MTESLDEKYSRITTNKGEWFKLKSESSNNGELYEMLRFKTGGMRGVMREGFNGINEVTCNILATALCKRFNSIVIGHDHRFNSSKFAYIFYKIFALSNKKVVLFKECVTPYLALESESTDVGVMVTASHNPMEYNGFKVYTDGSQIAEPLDKEIECDMMKLGFTDISKFLMGDWEGELQYTPINYTRYFSTFNLSRYSGPKRIKPVFSALYGVSSPFIKKACEFFNIEIDMKSESNRMDPKFPGIKYPNPEVHENYTLLFNQPDSTIFMCDPDGDRFGMGVLENNTCTIFNGDEIIKIFLFWFLRNRQNLCLANTFLCNDLFKSVSQTLGLKYIQTETGFKHLSKAVKSFLNEGTELSSCNSSKNKKACELKLSSTKSFQESSNDTMDSNTKVNKYANPTVIAYEDALGFLLGSGKEKDGVKAVVLMYMILQEHNIKDIFQEMSKFGVHNTHTVHIRVCNPKICLQEILKDKVYEKVSDRYILNLVDIKIVLRISGTESMIKLYATTNKLGKEDLIRKTQHWIRENIKLK